LKIRSTCIATFAVCLTGCYTLQPVGQVAPQPGALVGLSLTDAGRVAVGGQMGSEIDRVEGRLLSSENNEYLVAVTSVKTLRGAEQRWSGEQVRIRTEYVANSYERRFSRGRTIALGATTVAAITAVVLSRDLFGVALFGQGDDPPPLGEDFTRRLPKW
jgi:hypothetical protein